jgi:surface antigen
MLKKIALAALAVVFITGCAQQGQQPQVTKRDIGALSGAIIGGILGSEVGGGSGQLWATGAGAIIGSVIGSEIGKSLDQADQMYAERALEQAHSAPIGETIAWNNPESGHRGSFTPLREGSRPTTQSTCREYETTIYIEGRAETGTGIACQQPDGTWAITNN